MRAVTVAPFAAAAAVCLAAGAALAQQPTPPPPPQPCAVTFVRSPDDVRRVIEHWVRAEPRCATSLELRVIPTDGGLYLFARDAAGRIHERVVPDAQSAGVLVASWIADDSVAWAPAPPAQALRPRSDPGAPAPVPPQAMPAPAEPAGAYAPPAFAAPAAAPHAPYAPAPMPAGPALGPPGERAPIAPPSRPSPRPRWLSVGVTAPLSTDNNGVRVELDVLRRGAWTFGVALGAASGAYSGDLESAALETTDLRAVATVAHAFRRGPWQLRLQGGLGASHTWMEGLFASESGWEPFSGTGVSLAVEGSVTIGRDLGRRWAIDAGPMLTWYGQDLNQPWMASSKLRTADGSVFIGIRRAL